ncbi:hypothetical protein SH580_19575 [Coraliomargarita algicola]|uniref:Uncharacterized protein n=1 Tax=Coraliomargarita algicola TaxID=3092156 RepID=A0ABZ0RJB2_9BACT|nr:hypothetical protein [Coraliomargarita sp. J2-16]WPJ95622.1 hypothetical protein SH580_19575 [Coraliomargarita sp. J2-16]
MKLPSQILFPAIYSASLITSGLSLQAQTWDAASGSIWSSGDWSTAANWDPDGVPLNDGTADLIFDLSSNGNTGSFVTGLGPDSLSINSLTFLGTNAGNYSVTLAAGTTTGSAEASTTVTLNLGAGGIDLQGAKLSGAGDIFYLGSVANGNRVHLNLTENQTWDIQKAANGETNNHGTLRLAGDLSGAGNLTKTGNGLLRIESGSSDDYTGTVTLDGGLIQLYPGQLDRLGPNALQWHNTTRYYTHFVCRRGS